MNLKFVIYYYVTFKIALKKRLKRKVIWYAGIFPYYSCNIHAFIIYCFPSYKQREKRAFR